MRKIYFVTIAALLFNCSQYPKEKKETRLALHTVVSLTLYNKEPQKIFDEFFEELQKENALVSNWLETSYAAKINNQAGKKSVKVEDERIYSLIKRSIEFSQMTGGYFNVLIAPLTYLWGIGTEKARKPSEAEIKKSLNLLDLSKVSFQKDRIFLQERGMSIDLGSVGKGYLHDHMSQWLVAKGINVAIIDLGGDIYFLGKNPNKNYWSLGIKKPFSEQSESLGVLKVKENLSITTSGVYERFIEEKGEKYHHILNPLTGYPTKSNLVSVSVLHPNGFLSDASSTLGMVLGLEKAIKYFLEKNISAVLVTTDKKIYLVNISQDQFNNLDNSYKLIESR